MKYKKYYSRPKKLQQGGLATFSPNVNLGEAQLAARPGFDLQPLGQSSIVAPSAQPFQNTFSIENAARNTLLNERRVDLAEDQFRLETAKFATDQVNNLFDSLGQSIKNSTDPTSGLYLDLYGQDAVEFNRRVDDIRNKATQAAMAGDLQGMIQYTNSAKSLLNSDSSYATKLYNSQFFNTMADIDNYVKPGTGESIDTGLVSEAMIKARDWVMANPEKNIDKFWYSTEGQKYKQAYDKNFLFNKNNGKDIVDDLLSKRGEERFFDTAKQIAQTGDPELYASLERIEDGRATEDDVVSMLWGNYDSRAYLQTQGYTKDTVKDYIAKRSSNVGMSEDNQRKLITLADDVADNTPTKVVVGDQEYTLPRKDAQAVEKAKLEGNMKLANEIAKIGTQASVDSQLEAQKQAGRLEEIAAKGDGSKNSTVTYKYELPDGRVAGIPDARTKEIVDNSNGNFTSGDVEKAAEVIINLKEGTSDDDALKAIREVNEGFLKSDLQSIRNNIEYKAVPKTPVAPKQVSVPVKGQSDFVVQPGYSISESNVLNRESGGGKKVLNPNDVGKVSIGPHQFNGSTGEDFLTTYYPELANKYSGKLSKPVGQEGGLTEQEAKDLETALLADGNLQRNSSDYWRTNNVEPSLREYKKVFGTEPSEEDLIIVESLATTTGTKGNRIVYQEAKRLMDNGLSSAEALVEARVKYVEGKLEGYDGLKGNDLVQAKKRYQQELDLVDSYGDIVNKAIPQEKSKKEQSFEDLGIIVKGKVSKGSANASVETSNGAQGVDNNVSTVKSSPSTVSQRVGTDSIEIASNLVQNNVNSGSLNLDSQKESLAQLLEKREQFTTLRDKFLQREGSWATNQVQAHNTNIKENEKEIKKVLDSIDMKELAYQDYLNSPEFDTLKEDVLETISVEEDKFLNELNSTINVKGDTAKGQATIAGIKVYYESDSNGKSYYLKFDGKDGPKTPATLEGLTNLILEEVARQTIKS